jgi:hypothetical protein
MPCTDDFAQPPKRATDGVCEGREAVALGQETTMTTHNKPTNEDAILALCNARIAGLTKYAKGNVTIGVKGTPYKPTVLVAIYQKCIDTRTDLAAVRAEETAAMTARVAADVARKTVDASVLGWAVETFGPTSPQALAFGYVAPNPAKPTVETRAQAVTKARATREARGTGGKKQKAKITGASVATPGSTSNSGK